MANLNALNTLLRLIRVDLRAKVAKNRQIVDP